MKKTIRFIQAVHGIFILLVLTTFAVIPFYYPITSLGTFVILPLLMLLVIAFAIVIDSKLNTLLGSIDTVSLSLKKHVKACPFIKGICC
ncbi:hypothetical protein [Thalassotalea sediminis]|uniref:hypothetical protein n=1 Tax=Thalassotalea sediminis TaxID=1759089 RepID=UPI0025738C61|nr:hypothetical protein [Thalassotalea sediminis]